MEFLKGFLNKSKEKYLKSGFSKSKFLLVVGICGIILIGFSGMVGKKSTQNRKDEDYNSKKKQMEYVKELEDKIKGVVSAITGDENCVVAVTLEGGSEYVYLDQSTTDKNTTEDVKKDGSTTKDSEKSTKEFIVVKGEDGSENALIVTEKSPSVRGVAIVSYGVSDKNKEQISETLSAMLGVHIRKISITSKLNQ